VLRDRGAECNEQWVRSAVPPSVPGSGWEQFREIWSASENKPDGLLVTDDVLFRDVALGILDSRVQVPDQLEVVTHANRGSGIHYPFPVTRLEVDPNEYASHLAGTLIKRLRGELTAPRTEFIHARLITREEGEKKIKDQETELKHG
jgi:DNA-binding LacI/PurR family transcriptional regulator